MSGSLAPQPLTWVSYSATSLYTSVQTSSTPGMLAPRTRKEWLCVPFSGCATPTAQQPKASHGNVFVCTCTCKHTLQSCLQVALLGVLVHRMWPNKATRHHVLCWGCFCETRLCRVALLQVALLGFPGVYDVTQ